MHKNTPKTDKATKLSLSSSNTFVTSEIKQSIFGFIWSPARLKVQKKQCTAFVCLLTKNEDSGHTCLGHIKSASNSMKNYTALHAWLSISLLHTAHYGESPRWRFFVFFFWAKAATFCLLKDVSSIQRHLRRILAVRERRELLFSRELSYVSSAWFRCVLNQPRWARGSLHPWL